MRIETRVGISVSRPGVGWTVCNRFSRIAVRAEPCNRFYGASPWLGSGISVSRSGASRVGRKLCQQTAQPRISLCQASNPNLQTEKPNSQNGTKAVRLIP